MIKNKLLLQVAGVSCFNFACGLLFYKVFISDLALFMISLFLLISFNFLYLYKLLSRIYKINNRIDKIYQNNFPSNKYQNNDELIDRITLISQKLEKDQIDFNKVSKVRTEFLANVSHELKTPIFSIKGYTETLLDGAINDQNVNKKFVHKIETQANRLENLFTDLIDISKIESNQLVLNLDNFPLNRLLNWVENTFAEQINKKGLEFSVPDCEGIIVLGDEKYLKSVFSNLIKNSINYSHNGSIIIAAKAYKNKVKISITDHGIGISKEHINRVFERFYRVDSDRSRNTGGTGLGLSIVKHILESHGSSIDLESTPNKGSTFSFQLVKV